MLELESILFYCSIHVACLLYIQLIVLLVFFFFFYPHVQVSWLHVRDIAVEYIQQLFQLIL